MASIDKRPDGTYRARWREYPGGPQKTKSFQRKIDANDWLVKVQHELRSGIYVDAMKTRTTLAEYTDPWLRRMPVVATSYVQGSRDQCAAPHRPHAWRTAAEPGRSLRTHCRPHRLPKTHAAR
jgi:hypothetical protein